MEALRMVGLLFAWTNSVHAGDDVGVKQTIAYVQKLQTSNGGFLSMRRSRIFVLRRRYGQRPQGCDSQIPRRRSAEPRGGCEIRHELLRRRHRRIQRLTQR